MAFVGFSMGGETAGFLTGKMKRKDVEDVSEEFSEFSLSSPARKTRRLDLGLPPIFEEEEPPVDIGQLHGDNEQLATSHEAEPRLPQNEERALVLYKPVLSPSLGSELSNVFLNVDLDWFSGYKSPMLPPYYSNQATNLEDVESISDADKTTTASSTCLAVVPWFSSNLPETTSGMEETTTSNKSLEDEDMDIEGGGSSMDVEEKHSIAETAPVVLGPIGMNQGLQQWQQHCLDPHVPTNPSTPVMWSR